MFNIFLERHKDIAREYDSGILHTVFTSLIFAIDSIDSKRISLETLLENVKKI